MQEKIQEAVLLLETGNPRRAEIVVKKLLIKNPNDLVALQIISIAYIKQGKLIEAAEQLKKAHELDPSNHSILQNLGKSLLDQGRIDEAKNYLKKFIDMAPNNYDAWISYADVCVALGNHKNAIDSYKTATTIDPNIILGHLGLANCYIKIGENELARNLLFHLTELDPSNARPWELLIANCIQLNDMIGAKQAVDKVLSIRPNDEKYLIKRGEVQLECGENALSIKSFQEALQICPHSEDALLGLGNAFNESGLYSESLTILNNLLEINPKNKKALCSMGYLFKNVGDYEKARDFFEQAIALDENYYLALYNLAHIDLTLFKFKSGWLNYAHRWNVQGFTSKKLETQIPVWNGNFLEDKLLIWAEQGIGDQILYGGLLTQLAGKIKHITVQVDKKLEVLFKRSFPEFRIISSADSISESNFSAQIPIGSLGKYLINEEKDLQKNLSPYLNFDPLISSQIKGILSKANKPVCGLSWSSIGTKNSINKNIKLIELLPILKSLNCTFTDVGYVDTSEERKWLYENYGIEIKKIEQIDSFNDVDGLAAIIGACDFIITGSNSSAHLAGALGKKTYLLSPHYCGKFWYWQDRSGVSAWYPTVKIFNRPQEGEWSVISNAVVDVISSEYA